MIRQCAWCLYLLDADGMRIAVLPLPSLYEATHGMCNVCGKLWMDQVQDDSVVERREISSAQKITELVAQLQKEQHKVAPILSKPRKVVRLI